MRDRIQLKNMSDKLMINGKKYVSASIAANMTKYTQDYVGQLCRGDKVNATRIGRNWYVDIDSLLSYKEQSESGIVEISVSTPQDLPAQVEPAQVEPAQVEPAQVEPMTEPAREIQEEIVKAEPILQEEAVKEPEIEQMPAPTTPQRIVGEHIANYTRDESALLPPLKKISTETEPQEVSLYLKNELIQPKQKENTSVPKPPRKATPSLFNRLGSILWPLRERLALGLVLIVMFSAIFAFNSGEIIYIHESTITLDSETTKGENILASIAGVMSVFEDTAIEINSFVDDATYNFLYTP